MFEAHPFTIMSVPTGSPFSCMHAEYVPNYRKQESETKTDTEKSKHVRLIKKGGLVGIVLDARVAGDWICVQIECTCKDAGESHPGVLPFIFLFFCHVAIVNIYS